MENQFSDKGIINNRISAITPEQITGYSIERHPESKERPAEICCVLSHLKALQQGYDDGDEYFCVVEDDIILPKLDFDKIFRYLKDAEEHDGVKIDILQIYTSGHPYIINMLNKYDGTGRYIVPREECCPGTVYYMASRTGAKKLLDKYKIGEDVFDLSYSHWSAADNLLYKPVTTYILSYPVCKTNISLGSIIHAEHIHNHEYANNVIDHIHKQRDIMNMFT